MRLSQPHRARRTTHATENRADVERYGYAPYGEQTVMDASYSVKSGTDYGQYKGFTGQTLDPESGLWYFRFRYYDAGLGTFTSADPLGYPDGMNRHAGYFSALSLVDPMGGATRLLHWPDHNEYEFGFLLADLQPSYRFFWMIDGLNPRKEHVQINVFEYRWGYNGEEEKLKHEQSGVVLDWLPAGRTRSPDQQSFVLQEDEDVDEPICHFVAKMQIVYDEVLSSSGTQVVPEGEEQEGAPLGLEFYMPAGYPTPLEATHGPSDHEGIGMAGHAVGDRQLKTIQYQYTYANYTEECCEYWGDLPDTHPYKDLIIENIIFEGMSERDFAMYQYVSDPDHLRGTQSIIDHSIFHSEWLPSIRDDDGNVVVPGSSVHGPKDGRGNNIRNFIGRP